MRLRIFEYDDDLDAFLVADGYRRVADKLGLTEWNPVVWIGRLFSLDNDFGEHWFDNWDARELRAERARLRGIDIDDLLVIDAERLKDGSDGPCNPPDLRARFWRDVWISLELDIELLFDKARQFNARALDAAQSGDRYVAALYIPNLEERIDAVRTELAARTLPTPTRTEAGY